ncbi:MAG: hypothetical protein KDI15_11675 [Thiothrix sp.]|nr:hypothetical protein [Thiothrix sp.]HPE59407.1 hypothetical protein [Thiolinea sp.]
MKKVSGQLLLACFMFTFTAILQADDTALLPDEPGEAEVAMESVDEGIDALCESYAGEDEVKPADYTRYMEDCRTDMTSGLSDDMEQSGVAEIEAGGMEPPMELPPEASEAWRKLTPEQLVADELVEHPDPAAEQLSTDTRSSGSHAPD